MSAPATEARISRRVYVAVPAAEAEPGDVVEYLEGGTRSRRTHRVTGRRGGKAAAVRVELHSHEGAVQRWVPLGDVQRCWRRRAAS